MSGDPFRLPATFRWMEEVRAHVDMPAQDGVDGLFPGLWRSGRRSCSRRPAGSADPGQRREGGAVRSGLERWRMHVNYHLAAYEHWTDSLIDEGFGLEYLERARRETVHVHQACLSNRGELAIAALDHLCSVPGARTFRPCAARRLRELLQDSVHDSEMRRKFGKSVTVASGSKVRIARGRLMRGGGPNGGMRNST